MVVPTHLAPSRRLFDEEHEAFRDSFRSFLSRDVVPHYDRWSAERRVPRELFRQAAALGFLNMSIPEAYGGVGIDDFRFNTIVAEECQRVGVTSVLMGFGNMNNVCAPYFLEYANEEQKRRWLPGMAAGDLLTGIAMTEPHTGSDLAGIRTSAIRDGDDYVLNGAKTFITNGLNGDLFITAVKTDPGAKREGISLVVVESKTPGFQRGRQLDKIGLHAQDTAELFFRDARVPCANLLRQEGHGFRYMMANLPQERMSLAVAALAGARVALDWTVAYVKERTAFGRSISGFQNTRMALAELRTEIEIGQVFVDRCIEALVAGELTGEQAAMAKWWTTELQGRVVDKGVQFHGGYGYMNEYPIARAYADSRVTRIYGGTTEIMKEIIARGEGLR